MPVAPEPPTLEQAELVNSSEEITPEKLAEFLERLPEFEKNLARYSQDGNKDLMTKLEDVLQRAARGEKPEDGD